jgi:bacillithiol system protein YtxJ
MAALAATSKPLFIIFMALSWHELTAAGQLADIKATSATTPCLIFKHSTRCNISAIAKFRLEEHWAFDATTIQPFYLDLIEHRTLSAQIAEDFQVHHESPQVLLIVDGECVYDASHLDITVDELQEALAQLS